MIVIAASPAKYVLYDLATIHLVPSFVVSMYGTVQLQLHIITRVHECYKERAAVYHIVWLHVPRPRPTLSHLSMCGN